MRTVPSAPDVRMRSPSGANVALLSGTAVWPRRNGSVERPVGGKKRPVRVLQSPAVRGPAVTTERPSGLNDAARTGPKVAQVVNARDAVLADNEAISLPTKVNG